MATIRTGSPKRGRWPTIGVITFALLSGCAAPEDDAVVAPNTEGRDGGAGVGAAPQFDAEAVREAVIAVLLRQQEAWNDGDIDAFMDGYVRGERLRFTSAGTVRRGWQTTLERYLTTYPDRAAMGTLTFSDLEVMVLSADYAEVAGRWQLEREQDAPGGRYTLLFERAPTEAGAGDGSGGSVWRILHDHTSSDPSE